MTGKANKETTFGPGDWIVHSHHGVGQIKEVERMRMAGAENTYFRVEMSDSTIWIPIELADDGPIRAVSDKVEFQEAIDVLAEQPEELDSNINVRKSHFTNVIQDNSPTATAGLIRDMWARQQEKGIPSESERHIYRTLHDHFSQEWSVSMGIKLERANSLLDKHLQEGYAQTKAEPDPAQLG